MYDAHIHLDQYPYAHLKKAIAAWKKAGIKGVLAVSSDRRSARRILRLQAVDPAFVHAAVGYHPEQALPDERERMQLIRLIREEKHRLSAIGEIGLPHYAKEACSLPLKSYLRLLESFIALSKELDLPVVLHAVHDKAEPALRLLLEYGVNKAHFHWLKAPPFIVERILDSGYYLSVTPEVCYRERDQKLLRMIPLRQLLLETDGPWPFAGPFAGKTTVPPFLIETAKHVAKIKETSVANIQAHCNRNFIRLFQQKP